MGAFSDTDGYTTRAQRAEMERALRQVEAAREKLADLIDTAPLLDPDEPWTLAQVVAVLRDVRAALETE